MREIVCPGETGHLARVGDHDGLATALVEILADDKRARAMGEAARRRINLRFTARRMLAQIEELYRGVAGDHRTGN